MFMITEAWTMRMREESRGKHDNQNSTKEHGDRAETMVTVSGTRVLITTA
jgi:hypothetical protein